MRAADDFDVINGRMQELGIVKAPINIAGPAGNPTQPTGEPPYCGTCGTHQANGMPHSSVCPKYVVPEDDYYCCGFKITTAYYPEYGADYVIATNGTVEAGIAVAAGDAEAAADAIRVLKEKIMEAQADPVA